MESFNFAFRIATEFQLLLMILVLYKHRSTTPGNWLMTAYLLGLMCYIVDQPILDLTIRDELTIFTCLVAAGAIAVPCLFWLLALALFRDGFRLRYYHLLILVLSQAITWGDSISSIRHYYMQAGEQIDLMMMLFSRMQLALFAVLGFLVSIRDWRTDLVESRRRFRTMFIGVVGVYIVILEGATIFLDLADATPSIELSLQTMNFLLICMLILVFNVWIFRLGKDVLPEQLTGENTPSALIDAATTTRLDELRHLMESKRLFEQEGLTIGNLADTLRLPEYKLRVLINRELGYRNFNDFLNNYRIQASAEDLRNPEKRHLPVLTIAMNNGYRSLAPFNKAFKATFNQTPTQYRKQNLNSSISTNAD
ncbi:MAG: helix-turn-helix transcriptional regulator [Pseudomonadota bacterium]